MDPRSARLANFGFSALVFLGFGGLGSRVEGSHAYCKTAMLWASMAPQTSFSKLHVSHRQYFLQNLMDMGS